MQIDRSILDKIHTELRGEAKIILLYGPRQAGKTTLLEKIQARLDTPALFLSGDDIRTQDIWGSQNLAILKQAVGETKLLIIDEAQRIPNIGVSLKLLFDAMHIPIIASGSSSFDLANRVNEPLTGRSTTFTLYPVSLLELPVTPPDLQVTARLEECMRFGMYPKTLTIPGEDQKQQYLYDLVNTYLYKDILSFAAVRKPKKVIDLLSLLALQLGSEVSVAELAQHLSISRVIVEKYLDLLEKMFILINIRGFSRNLRKEISKTSKYYFVDIGLRNGLIRNMNPMALRSDAGALFENFCIVERIKALTNRREYANHYFWRTYDQKEIDLIEDRGGILRAYECKWSKTRRASAGAPREFSRVYPTSIYTVVNPQSILTFLTG